MFELAQNFRDAIYVAHKLNFRYIWIDSLCILQKGERSESGRSLSLLSFKYGRFQDVMRLNFNRSPEYALNELC